MAKEEKCKGSDVEQQVGIVLASMGNRLECVNSLDDLWNKFTLTELQMLTSLSEEQVRARLPKVADKLLSLARETQSADLSANRASICCWQVCCWHVCGTIG